MWCKILHIQTAITAIGALAPNSFQTHKHAGIFLYKISVKADSFVNTFI